MAERQRRQKPDMAFDLAFAFCDFRK